MCLRKVILSSGRAVIASMKIGNILAFCVVYRWVKRYEKHGIAGIANSNFTEYDGEFKVTVIEYMNNNRISQSKTACYLRK